MKNFISGEIEELKSTEHGAYGMNLRLQNDSLVIVTLLEEDTKLVNQYNRLKVGETIRVKGEKWCNNHRTINDCFIVARQIKTK